MYTLLLCYYSLTLFFKSGYTDEVYSAGALTWMRWIRWVNIWTWVMRITAAYIHLKYLKATWDFLPQLHPALIGYCVRMKLCAPKLTLGRCANAYLYHIGKSVNVKAVSQLINMHTATKYIPYSWCNQVLIGWNVTKISPEWSTSDQRYPCPD